ncbi:hypothetical protein BpHYR1_033307, partial [Brachionus plicatilis]
MNQSAKYFNNMSLSILVDNGEALISFSCTFLSNGSDLTQSRNRYPYFYDERVIKVQQSMLHFGP